ncbi:MAG: chitobiase/beta-hexosaminidase C-terminal domain-containing protein, partial [Candidatus Cloacimonadaceae bacterium]|nr:chitobiase/beta-hexosaminidase C-terminal domain-containing protein [Candidatus Cloacimonadaceae bacterium]
IDAAVTLRAVAIKAGWLPAYITGSYDFAAAAPVFAPPAGSYASAQNVTLTSTTIGATIRYTTDGTDPSPINGMNYVAPIIVDVNQTIKAYSIKAGYQDSPIVSATYAIGTFIPVVATPVLTPASGIYPIAQNVSIATTTDGATVRYTMDGSEPDLTSPLFLAPINVPLNTTMTIKAKAFKTDWMPSATATEVYIITGTVSDVVFNPPGGSYSAAQNVVLSSATEGAYFRYTTDGSEPTDTSTLYTVPISVPLNTTMTIKAKAYKSGWLPSATGTETYNVTGQVVLTQPVFSPGSGNYNAPQMVSISAPIPADATIHYTIDGSEPSEINGMLYAGAFEIAQTTLVKAIAFKAGWQNSLVASAQYSFGVIAPSFAPVSGIYTTPQSVTISSPTVGASIRYTTDGSDPSPTFGTIYSGAINVPMDSSLFIKAIAYKDGWTPSQIVSANYVVTGQVSDIMFSIPGGTYNTAQNVILSTLTDGATIRYTLDGSDPTVGSTLYTTAINVPLNSSVTIKARGFKSNWLPSNIGTEIYNVTGTTAFDQPVLTPAPGTYANAISVAIGTPIPNDAAIYYTLDGTVPAADNGMLYGAPIPIDAAVTLRAVAIKAGWLPAYITGSYDFAAAAPVFAPAAGSYASAQNVILTSTTIGATIRYTTDGTDPSPVNGMDYVAPITVSINQTIKAYSIKAGYQDSPIVSATYAIGTFVPVVATPVFNPLGGTYATAQDVSITTSTPGATIHYTIDGSDPNMTSPLYGAPINIPLDTVMTLKAIAYRTDWIESQIAVATYNITGTVADV